MREADRADRKVAQVVAAAKEAGVDIAPVTFERETRTSKDAAREVGCDVAEIVKSLVFQVTGTGETVLLLLSGADRVDLEMAAEAMGVDGLERADANRAKEATGYSIGATPPLGLATPLRVVMDDRILDFDTVWAAGGRTDTVFPIVSKELARISGAEILVLREDARDG